MTDITADQPAAGGMNMHSMNRKRRNLVVGAAALVLQTYGMHVRADKGEGRAVSLADFGGTPGADPDTLVAAFNSAFAHLKSNGGGKLLVPPGIYDFGPCAVGGRVVSVDDLRNVVISAYGATFKLNTTARVIPVLFYFFNPNNVAIAGARFNDVGYAPGVDWQGMYCAKAESDRSCSGFRMRDCHVDGAVGLFQSLQHDQNRYLMKDIHLHASVKNAYYGAGLTYVGDNASVELTCENVRRGCIAYGLRNAEIRIRMRHDGRAPASNGFISLACEGENAGNVENVRVDLDVSGTVTHSALVHFYHQKTEQRGVMRNISVHVTLNNLQRGRATTSIFLFDHELPDATIVKTTARSWDQISLSGKITGNFSGRIIHNPSMSTAPGTIYVDPGLVSKADMAQLAKYFRFKAI